MSDTVDFAATLAQAEALCARGAFAEVVALLSVVATLDEPNAAVFRLLGLAQLGLGTAAACLATMAAAVQREPDDPQVALLYGVALQSAGRIAEAAAQYRRAAEGLPNDAAPLVNWAAALIALGDAKGAIRVAKRGLLLAPQMPQAHYVLGQALLAAGRWAGALAAFRRSTDLNPQFADGWINAGLAEYRLGRMDAAMASMCAALQVDPDNVKAAGNLAVFMRLTGQAGDAERILHQVARFAAAADARLSLASGLLEEDRHEEALALLESEQPSDPALVTLWQLQHALALVSIGDAARAGAILDAIGRPPPIYAPMLSWRRVLVAEAEGDIAAARAHARETENALRRNGQDMLPENRIMAHFDLAKFWSAYGERERAFGFWVSGHALLRQIQPFSRAGFRAFVNASITGFSRARLHEGPLASNRDPAPVFIVGMPRSGTTLAEQILGAHPAAHAAGERPELGRLFSALGKGADDAAGAQRVAALDTEVLDAAATRYLAELHALAPEAARIVDKMPANALYLGLITTMLPRARIIHCVRDPRDTGFSIFTYRFYGEHPYAHDLGDLGWYMAQHARLMAHWHEALPTPPLRLSLVDWVADFQGTLARVLDYVGLPYDPACERFFEQEGPVRTVSRKQVREPVNARGLGRWKPYAAQLAPMIAELAKLLGPSDDEILRARTQPR